MNRFAVLMVTLGLSLASIPWGWAAEPSPDQATAIAEIRKLQGKVTVDEDSPDKPAIGVNLAGTQVTDDGLQQLEGLTQLKSVNLSNTAVGDAGLEHLEGLTHSSGAARLDQGQRRRAATPAKD